MGAVNDGAKGIQSPPLSDLRPEPFDELESMVSASVHPLVPKTPRTSGSEHNADIKRLLSIE